MSVLQQIGTDFEFFVADASGDVISGIGLIGGSKEQPLLVEGGNLQEDNVLAEAAIDPCNNLEEWLLSISSVRQQLSAKLGDKQLVCKSSHHYTKEQLLSFPPAAMVLGCTADFNVYKGRDNPTPSAKTRLRTAAGHVHFSYHNPTISATRDIVKCLDATLGLWSVITDDDVYRRNLYGKAGCVRFKPYGGEYRTLGNFWLTNTARQTYVWRVTKLCVEQHAILLPMLRARVSEQSIQTIINESDRERARLLMPSVARIIEEMLKGDKSYANAA